MDTIITAGLMPGYLVEGVKASEPRLPEAEADLEMCWIVLRCSSCPGFPPSVNVQAYIKMFLLNELASPVGNATGIRVEKDT